ncbi:MAG: A/G-specific adenine glycosylase [Firmicutes bacterium]|nr:A/G-specific adenine glycosylase [Bacillota bacterium]
MDRTEKLLSWYDENRRILPWREDPSPYHVWISEIMLQQTRVEAVKSYYSAFLEELPSVRALAEAGEDEYLKLWEGLGYYSRVRNLHKAAGEIMERYDGEMPRTYEELRSLSGIGEYTAAAIASIAFGEAVPAIDGNLLRIFSRLTGYAENILASAAKKEAFRYYSDWISPERPGAFNQALMDLGAMVCLPNTAPQCADCPLSSYCAAHEAGNETALPVRPAKKKRAVDKMTVFVIHHDGRILLNKRPAQGLLAGLYEFPNVSGWMNEKKALQYAQSLGFSALRIVRLPDAKHIFSHREWHIRGYEIFTGDWNDPAGDDTATGGPAAEKAPGAGLPEEELRIAGRTMFLADSAELESRWSIPSAFAAFRSHLLKN